MIILEPPTANNAFVRYTIQFTSNGVNHVAEVHEIFMEDWVLFECFLQPDDLVGYLAWENDAPAPEWVDSEAGINAEQAAALIAAITERRKPPTASMG